MIAEPTAPIEIFICYAREDEEYRQGLEKQLRILKRQGFITIWHDREIIPGTEWQSEIDRHLKSAQIILLLVSPDFMDSDYCYSIEMQNAMERHQRGEAHVIPIIVHHVYWQEAPFGKLQVLPTDARPITDHSWHNLNEAFYDVTVGIREVINKVREEQQRWAEEKWQRKLREEQLRVARLEQHRRAEEERQRKIREERPRPAKEYLTRSSKNYYTAAPKKNNNVIATNVDPVKKIIAKKYRDIISIRNIAAKGTILIISVDVIIILLSLLLNWESAFFISVTLLVLTALVIITFQ